MDNIRKDDLLPGQNLYSSFRTKASWSWLFSSPMTGDGIWKRFEKWPAETELWSCPTSHDKILTKVRGRVFLRTDALTIEWKSWGKWDKGLTMLDVLKGKDTMRWVGDVYPRTLKSHSKAA